MLRSIRTTTILLATALPLASIAWTSAVGAQEQATSSAILQQSDIQLTMELAARVKAEVATKPATISVEDLEAIIVFILSQGDYSDAVIANTLSQVEVGASVKLREATANARQTLLKRKKRGTGSIGSAFGGFGAFSPPGVAPGGGSNYQ